MHHRVLLPTILLGILLAGCQDEDNGVGPIQTDEDQAQILAREGLESDEQILGKLPPFAREITGPTVITQPGFYRVTADFAVADPSGDAIVVRADRVLLDLGHHTISGPGNKAGRGIVVDGASRVVVRNGSLATFGMGVVLIDASRSAVKHVHVTGGDETADPGAGNPPQIGIMLINSSANWLVWNRVDLVNLGIFVRGSGSTVNRIAANNATGGLNGLLGICYNPAPGVANPSGDGPTRDRVFLNRLERFGTGIQTTGGSSYNTFFLNTLTYFNMPYEDLNGTNIFRNNRATQIAP